MYFATESRRAPFIATAPPPQRAAPALNILASILQRGQHRSLCVLYSALDIGFESRRSGAQECRLDGPDPNPCYCDALRVLAGLRPRTPGVCHGPRLR